MSANFLIDAVWNEDQNIEVVSGLCQRVGFRKSDCRMCQEICPEKAIFLNPGPVIGNVCSDCGLCLNACPTEVFRHELHTDRYLLNQAGALLGRYRYRPPGEKKTLLILCQRVESSNANSLLLPCLGRITPTIIVGAAVCGFDEVVLTKGVCSRCQYVQGEKLLSTSVAASQVLLESFGLDRFEIRIVQKEQNKGAPLGRREIFLRISNKVKNKASAFLYRREKAILEKLAGSAEIKNSREHLPRRQLLRRLLERNRPHKDTMIGYNPEFPWGRIKIEQSRCSGCGTCVALCPTGAVSKEIGNDCLLLFFNSALCTNCSVCRSACPEQAIDFEADFAIADILAQEPTVLAAIKLSTCIVCGESISSPDSKLCATCRKRQIWPMYVKV